MSDQSPLN